MISPKITITTLFDTPPFTSLEVDKVFTTPFVFAFNEMSFDNKSVDDFDFGAEAH